MRIRITALDTAIILSATVICCPFCGGTDIDVGTSKIFGGMLVGCGDCGMVAMPSSHAHKRDAIGEWNRREAADPHDLSQPSRVALLAVADAAEALMRDTGDLSARMRLINALRAIGRLSA